MQAARAMGPSGREGREGGGWGCCLPADSVVPHHLHVVALVVGAAGGAHHPVGLLGALPGLHRRAGQAANRACVCVAEASFARNLRHPNTGAAASSDSVMHCVHS